jgi:cell division protein FtsZ
MKDAGSALMGIGAARGENRAVDAAELAISSPLLEASIEGAHGVLLSIAGGSDLGLFEIHQAAGLIHDAAHAEANIIFGTVIDDALGDEVRVTVIAAGFDGGRPLPRTITPNRRAAAPAESSARPAQPASSSESTSPPATTAASGERATDFDTGDLFRDEAAAAAPKKVVVFDDSTSDDLDIPEWLK